MFPARIPPRTSRTSLIRVLALALVALGWHASSASAQLFGKNGPSISPPKVKVPEVKVPPVKVPPVKVPDIKVPDVKVPPVKVPDVKVPPVKVPDVKVPPVKVPPVKVPDVKVPDIKVPPVKVPDVKIPPVKVPPVKVPDVKFPDVKVPPIKIPPILKKPDPNVLNQPDVVPSKPSNPNGTKPSPNPNPNSNGTKPSPNPINPNKPNKPNNPNTKPGNNTIVIVIPGGLLKPPAPPVVPPIVPNVVPPQPNPPVVPPQPPVPEPPPPPPPTPEPPAPPAPEPPTPPAPMTPNAVRVTERVLSGPAATAGIELGDIILKVGGQRVRTSDDFTRTLAVAKGKVEVVYFNPRDNKVETRELQPEDGSLGVTVENIAVDVEEEPQPQPEPNPQPEPQPQPTGETALQITEVTARSAAGRAGLQTGDVIVAINGKRVSTPEQLTAALKAAKEEADVLFVNPDDGKAETRKVKVTNGEIGLKVQTVAVSEK